MEPAIPARTRELSAGVQLGYALGDFTLNIQLAAVSLFLLFFLSEVAGLPPAWAGLVLWIGRAVDAFTDPAMGSLSDRTRWRRGRRRPYFLIGAVPFGLTFALLWHAPHGAGATEVFALFAGVYAANTVCSTVLAVPYMALLPEMALGYQQRTSLNTWRSVAVMVSVLLTATGMPWLVDRFGGGAPGYARAGALFGVAVALPWLVVHAVSWERPELVQPGGDGLLTGARRLLRHATYRNLASFFLAARVALDVAGAMLLFYFTHWLGRPDDFAPAMGILLLAAGLSLPVWLVASRRADKRTLFLVAVGWWITVQLGIAAVRPEHPRWVIFTLMGLAGVGYGMADLMPWSMLGDVIDEDELASGARRDGIYAGFFTFLRKLGGATGVALAGLALQLAGFERGGAVQGEAAREAIRWLTALAPAAALAAAAWLARGYPLGRARHEALVAALARRRAEGGRAGAA